MTFNTAISFVGWLLKKQFGGVGRLYMKYDNFVVDEPGMAIFPTFLISLLTFIATMVLGAILGTGLKIALLLALTAVFSVIVNYFRIILREQFKQFRKERQELFNVIKESK